MFYMYASILRKFPKILNFSLILRNLYKKIPGYYSRYHISLTSLFNFLDISKAFSKVGLL